MIINKHVKVHMLGQSSLAIVFKCSSMRHHKLGSGLAYVLLVVRQPTACIWCRAAAQSLIRGRDGDVSLGWDMPAHRTAAVLCFDEMQVTDPFAAVALKGSVHCMHQITLDSQLHTDLVKMWGLQGVVGMCASSC